MQPKRKGRIPSGEDVVEHGGQGVGIADDHDQAGHDVDDCHDGHQLLGDSAQALDAAEQNHGGQDDQDDAQDDVDQGLLVKVGVEGGDHGVDSPGGFGIGVTRPLCGIQRDGNRKSQGALARLCEFPGSAAPSFPP